MKKLFLFAFAFCFLLGIWQGWEEKQKSTEEDYLVETALTHMHVHHVSGWSDNDSTVEINYVCGDETVFKYDLSTLHQTVEGHIKVASSTFSFEALASIFEGATGLKLFEIARGGAVAKIDAASDVIKSRKTVTIVLGALSGYYAGRLISMRQRVPCNSSQLIDKLRDANSVFSTRVRREYFIKRMEGLYFNVDRKEYRVIDIEDKKLQSLGPDAFTGENLFDSPARMLKLQNQLRKRFAWTDYSPTSKEYNLAVIVIQRIGPLLAKQPKFLMTQFPGAKQAYFTYKGPYDPNDPISSSAHTSFYSFDFMEFVLLVTVSIAIFIVAFIIVSEVLDKRKIRRS